MTCNAELECSITACPQTPMLYYFAARVELSRSAQATPSKEAVRWLFRCVRDYYQELPAADFSLSQVLILYRYIGGGREEVSWGGGGGEEVSGGRGGGRK